MAKMCGCGGECSGPCPRYTVSEHPPVRPPYYEVTVRLPLARYDEVWFDRVADAAGPDAAVSGSVVPSI